MFNKINIVVDVVVNVVIGIAIVIVGDIIFIHECFFFNELNLKKKTTENISFSENIFYKNRKKS